MHVFDDRVQNSVGDDIRAAAMVCDSEHAVASEGLGAHMRVVRDLLRQGEMPRHEVVDLLKDVEDSQRHGHVPPDEPSVDMRFLGPIVVSPI